MKKNVALVLAGTLALTTLPYNVFASSNNSISNMFISAKDVSYIKGNATTLTATTYADLIANENNETLTDYYKSISAKLGSTGEAETIYTNFYDVESGNQLIITNDGTGVLALSFDTATSKANAPKITFEMLTDLTSGSQFEIKLENGIWSKDPDLYLPGTGNFFTGLDAYRRDDETLRLTATTIFPADSEIKIPLIAELEGGEPITVTVDGGSSAITGGIYTVTNLIEGDVTLEGDNGILTIKEDMPGTLNPEENLYIQIRGSNARWVDDEKITFTDNKDFGLLSAEVTITETEEENVSDLEDNLVAGTGEFYGRTLVLDIPGTVNESGFSSDYEIDLTKVLQITDRDFDGQVELVVWGADISSSDKQTVKIFDLEGDVEIEIEDEDIAELISGRNGEEASDFTVIEKVDGSLRDDRYIRFELSEGATWDVNATTIKISDADVTGKFNLIPDDDDENIVYLDKGTVTFDTNTLNELEIDPVINLDADTDGDITVTISGPGISSGEVEEVIATTKAPVTVDTEINHIKAGFTNIPTADITIRENFAGALASGEYKIFADLEDITGLKISEVTEETIGDNELEAEITLKDNDIIIDVTSESKDEPEEITITGIEIYADSTVPTSKNAFEFTLEGTNNTEELVNGIDFEYVTTGNLDDEANMFDNKGTANFNTNVEISLGDTAYTIDGEYQGELLAPAYVSPKGSTMVPVRALSYALGIDENKIFWHQPTQTVTIQVTESRVAQFTVGSDICTINGIDYPIVSASGQVDIVEVRNGYTYLPLRFIGEQVMNVKVDWDNATQTAIFNPTNTNNN